MMRPRPRAIMPGSTAREQFSVPATCTSIVRHQASGSTSQALPIGPQIPALLTRMSIFPAVLSIAAMPASTEPRSVTSKCAASARPLRATISATTRVRSDPVRPVTATVAPASASASANTRPRPRPPPVTTATRSCSAGEKCRSVILNFLDLPRGVPALRNPNALAGADDAWHVPYHTELDQLAKDRVRLLPLRRLGCALPPKPLSDMSRGAQGDTGVRAVMNVTR